MVKYGFFNAKKLITGDYDRKYNADDVNAYFKGAISQDGIYQFVGNQCRVIPAGNMNVYVRDGKGQINYHWFELTSNELVSIREAHATLNRWTAIVARYDAANRNIYLLTIDGTDSEHPSKPQIQRTDTLRDICLAYVYVAAGTTEITRDDIEDTVEDIEVCGFVETLLKSDSAAVKVHQLPIPSKSCQGNIYYLIEESKTAGKTYVKGYYYCEPSRTEYDYIDFDWTSDTLSNRPVASEEYLEILFYANDNTTWYRCVEVSDNTYEWQEVTVNVVEELPEPTEELNDQFYILGNSLYKVSKQESNYKWYMFGTGGGGGHGDYAIIRIEYPEGTEVQVTFDGDTVDAPDTSGVWIYGCDKAGTYVVGIKNTTTTKSIEITAAGQVEDIFISPQVINHNVLYLMGDVNGDVMGNLSTYINGKTSRVGGNACVYGSSLVNTDNYTHFAVWISGSPSVYNGEIMDDINLIVGKGAQNNTNLFENVMYNSGKLGTGNNKFFVTSNLIQGVNKNLGVGIKFNSTTWGGTTHTSDIIINNSNVRYYHNSGGGLGSITDIYIKCFMLYNANDDISGLSAYGSTISEILNNSANLFQDTAALTYMVSKCTGDFLVAAFNSPNFIYQINNSPNKTIIQANEYWAKFLALLS